MRLMISAAAYAARHRIWLLAPVALDDTASTGVNAAVVIDVLANDSHPLGETLTIASAAVSAAQGDVAINPDGTLTFTPATDFTGTATITYVVEDEGGQQTTATVAVEVILDDLFALISVFTPANILS